MAKFEEPPFGNDQDGPTRIEEAVDRRVPGKGPKRLIGGTHLCIAEPHWVYFKRTCRPKLPGSDTTKDAPTHRVADSSADDSQQRAVLGPTAELQLDDTRIIETLEPCSLLCIESSARRIARKGQSSDEEYAAP